MKKIYIPIIFVLASILLANCAAASAATPTPAPVSPKPLIHLTIDWTEEAGYTVTQGSELRYLGIYSQDEIEACDQLGERAWQAHKLQVESNTYGMGTSAILLSHRQNSKLHYDWAPGVTTDHKMTVKVIECP